MPFVFLPRRGPAMFRNLLLSRLRCTYREHVAERRAQAAPSGGVAPPTRAARPGNLATFGSARPRGLRRRGPTTLSSLVLALGALAAVACDDTPQVDPGAGGAGQGDQWSPERRAVVERGLDVPESLSCESVAAVPSEARLLTRSQYERSVHVLFPELPSGQTAEFPAETKVFFFGTSQEHHRITPLLAEVQMRQAERIADWAVAHGQLEAPCQVAPVVTGEACAERLIEDYGSQLFRRPVESPERDVLLSLFRRAADELGDAGALRVLLETLLQAPAFLYRIERSGADEEPGKAIALGPYELATRLSFLIHNGPPDAELLRAAEAGELAEVEGLEQQAQRLLAQPQALSTLQEFFKQWLGAELLEAGGAVRDLPATGTTSAQSIALDAGWLRSLELFVQSVFQSETPSLPALFTSDQVFLDSTMAPLFGKAVPLDAGFVPFELEAGHRAGLLTQPAVLAMFSHPTQTGPVQRGVFVLDRMLCSPPTPPPPGLAVVAPDPDPRLTTRERFAVHTEQAGCRACHEPIDSIGFVFEQFDHLGRLRLTENGQPVDATGAVLDGAADSLEDGLEGAVDGVAELAQRLAGSAQLQTCAATQWYQFAMGRVQREEDLCSLIAARDALLNSNGDLRELMLSLVRTDGFRYRTNPQLRNSP